MQDAVIVSACRTPIGKIRGSLTQMRPDDLLALVFKEAVQRAKISAEAIDEAFAGCANQAGEDNRNIARMATLLAGFPQTVPAVTVNRLCASGLEAIIQASRAIQTGDAQVILAGGVESMSRAPWSMGKPEIAYPSGAPAIFDTALGWRFPNPQMEQLFRLESMGETAENLAEQFAIGRTEQDEFALLSHQRAIAAQESGWFEPEIVSVSIAQKKGAPTQIAKDEGPRADSNLESLTKLSPAFRPNGTVTAGNSSSLNDGAAALVITSREYAKAHGLAIRAKIKASASAGVSPRIMGIGPVPATQKALKKAGLETKDIDIVELNEAFAVQSIAVMRELKLTSERVNLHGGAIALGHPLGCSGARILTTLLSVMERKQATLGLATLCVGVGQGVSLIIERE